MWSRRAALAGSLVLLAATLAACGGKGSEPPSSARIEGANPPAERCGPPARSALVVTLRTSDGVRLDGAIVGSGERGVVLVHEAGVRVLCGWWPYAARLAARGFRVLIFDLRCYGLSDCPSSRRDDLVADVAAAVDELPGRGCSSIELVGASYGGSVALVAAARLEEISAVADLSGDEIGAPIGGEGRPLTASKAAAGVHIPVLLALARDDGYIPLPDERALFRRLGSSRKRLIVLPASAGHGWDLLVGVGSGGPWSRFERTLTAFLVRHGSRS
jgi:dienelactone hydrolase